MKNEAVRLDRVTYDKGGSRFLDNVNLHIFQGEIMGLINLNSVGQDELVQLLYKNLPLHFGHLYMGERLVNSYRRGYKGMNRTAVIEKRSHLVDDLTVEDNIFVLRPEFNQHIINRKELYNRFQSYTRMLGLGLEAGQPVSRLSHFQRVVVELLKAVITGSELIIMRDISNFIGQADLKRMHGYMQVFAGSGISFLYICNHHEELFQICSRLALMEDGRVLKVLDSKDFRDDIVMKYALDFSRLKPRKTRAAGQDDVFRLEALRSDNIYDVSISVGKGECVTLLDLDNRSLADFAGLLTGDTHIHSGAVWLDGQKQSAELLAGSADVRLIKENPTKTMLFPELSYLDNLCFTMAEKHRSKLLQGRVKRAIAHEYRSMTGGDIYAHTLNGLSLESLYNLVYYQTHLQNPRIVFLEQPFAGADMYLRHHVLYLINRLREKGIAIIILAVSISDSLLVSDRLFTLQEGSIHREYALEDFYLLYARS